MCVCVCVYVRVRVCVCYIPGLLGGGGEGRRWWGCGGRGGCEGGGW